jgi:hypothetical protein
MVRESNIRELVAEGVIRGAKTWGVENQVSAENVKEVVDLGDEATYLNTLGFSPTEDIERLERMAKLLESQEAAQALRREGQRWQVTGIVNTAVDILPRIAESLAVEASPGRVGRLMRAIPVLAGSHSSPLALSLSRVLNAEPFPNAMITAYGQAFCQREETILAEIDRLIIDDRILGPLALELTGRILKHLGWDGFNLDAQSREALVNCLTLLVHSALEKGISA